MDFAAELNNRINNRQNKITPNPPRVSLAKSREKSKLSESSETNKYDEIFHSGHVDQVLKFQTFDFFELRLIVTFGVN